MAAPKKAEGDTIVQVKVHVKRSDLKIYNRKLIESLISQHKNGEFHIVELKVPKFKKLPEGFDAYSDIEKQIAANVITNYRNTKNMVQFMNRIVQIK